MSRDESAYRQYVDDCNAKKIPAAAFGVWQLITKPLGWQVIGYSK
jgi:hypothetical protein